MEKSELNIQDIKIKENEIKELKQKLEENNKNIENKEKTIEESKIKIKNLEFKIETQKRFNNELKNTISIHDTKLGKLNNKLESISNVVNDKEATTKYYKEKID